MANTKVSDLTALTTTATDDILPIVDVSDTTQASSGTTKKITWANFILGITTGFVDLTTAQTLTNKKLSDSTTTIVDVSDATKAIKFDVAGTTAVTGTVATAFTTAKTVTIPDATDTLTGKATTDTLTNKRITKRVVITTQSATPTINTDNTDVAAITGLAQAITSFTTNLSGTPVAGDLLIIQITDNGSARGITWGASFASTTTTLPTTTVISTMLRIGFQWNTATSKWDCIATA